MIKDKERMAIHDALQEVDNYVRTEKKYTLRIELLSDGAIGLIVGARFNPPKSIKLKEIPESLKEPLALLKMLNKSETLRDIGKRVSENAFYIYITLDHWDKIVSDAERNKNERAG